MLLGTHRTAATTNDNCTRIYIRKKVKRSTPLSSRELLVRGRFAAVSAAVKVRAKDLMQISDDQAAFLAQKDQPDGKKTMKAYLWKVCGDEYDAQHS
jgi:hypothetical protein